MSTAQLHLETHDLLQSIALYHINESSACSLPDVSDVTAYLLFNTSEVCDDSIGDNPIYTHKT